MGQKGQAMTSLLSGAGEFVLWCMAAVIAAAVAAVAFLWAYDKWTGWRWEKKRRVKG
jgi:membrane protein YdbS with pleckstrin-like domain